MKILLKYARIIAALSLLNFAAVCGLAVAAVAQESPPQMTVGDAQQALVALRNLDGRQVVVQVNGQNAIVLEPWQFKSGALRLAIAEDITALGKLEAATERARQSIVREVLKVSGADRLVPGTKEMDEFIRQYNEVLAAPYADAPKLARIDAKLLQLDVNEISGTTLSALAPLLNR